MFCPVKNIKALAVVKLRIIGEWSIRMELSLTVGMANVSSLHMLADNCVSAGGS